MTNLWLKVRIWTKVVLFTFVAFYIICFIIGNRKETANVWVFFGSTLEKQPLLEVIAITLGIGIVGTLLAGLVRGTIRQMREVRAKTKAEQLQKDVADMKAKAAKLQVQDEKPTGGA